MDLIIFFVIENHLSPKNLFTTIRLVNVKFVMLIDNTKILKDSVQTNLFCLVDILLIYILFIIFVEVTFTNCDFYPIHFYLYISYLFCFLFDVLKTYLFTNTYRKDIAINID